MMKNYCISFLGVLLLVLSLSACGSDVLLENDARAEIVLPPQTVTVENCKGERVFILKEYPRPHGDMPVERIISPTGINTPVYLYTFESEYFTFQLPEHSALERSVGVFYYVGEDGSGLRQTASLYSGTATLYQDGSVVLDGDLTEFEVRVQLPEDQKHQWVIEGNGAEQDHVEIYFKNGEPVVESINDDLTYTVEKEEYSH